MLFLVAESALSSLKANEGHYLNLCPFAGFYTTHSYAAVVAMQMHAHQILLEISGSCEIGYAGLREEG